MKFEKPALLSIMTINKAMAIGLLPFDRTGSEVNEQLRLEDHPLLAVKASVAANR